MEFPISEKISLKKEEINIKFYSGLTIFIGSNGSGKTSVLRKLKSCSFGLLDPENQIRYLSSNRIGTIEQYRSKTNQYDYSNDECSIGDEKTKEARHQIETATGDFFTMDERKDIYIKVSERLSTLLNKNVFIKWDSGNLKVFFSDNQNSNEEYSIKSEASGILNLISILAALYDDDVKVLLLDEPEVSLHPQLQKFVLNEIKKVAGDYDEVGKKMIVMATHSTEMIDIKNIKDLSNYVFFKKNDVKTTQIEPDNDILKNKKLNELIIRMGQMHKAAFFSEKALLVEGLSDLIVCNYLDNRYDYNLGIAGTQIIPVEGKGQFATVVKLIKIIGKEPIILTDLDALTDNNEIVSLFYDSEKTKRSILETGHKDLQEFVNSVKKELNSLCDIDKDSLKSQYENHPYWINIDNVNNDDQEERKRLIRALTAVTLSTEDSKIQKWENSDEWINLKVRLNVLLNCLEECGCFVLRKGALESYYMHKHENIFDGKPSSAIEEIEYLQDIDIDKVSDNYDVIVRCIKYSANASSIDETVAVKRELLSEISPMLGQFNEKTNENEINTIIKQVKGNNNSLFEYKIDYPKIDVNIKSNILNVQGFPITFNKGDNVNSVVEEKIINKS